MSAIPTIKIDITSLNYIYKDNKSQLMRAVLGGSLILVQILVAGGAMVDLENSRGSTALMYAAQQGQLAISRFLLEKGANVNKKQKDGYSPLMIAARFGKLEVVELLLDDPEVEIDATTNIGNWTALLLAVRCNHLAIVQLLLKKGANLRATNSNGVSAYKIASIMGLEEVEQALESCNNAIVEEKN